MTRPRLHAVEQCANLAHCSSPAPTRLQLTRALAKAMAAEDRALAALAKARAEVDAAFHPWARGRSISRDQARAELASTGHLPERKVWE